jgi:hypothetical protein
MSLAQKDEENFWVEQQLFKSCQVPFNVFVEQMPSVDNELLNVVSRIVSKTMLIILQSRIAGQILLHKSKTHSDMPPKSSLLRLCSFQSLKVCSMVFLSVG